MIHDLTDLVSASGLALADASTGVRYGIPPAVLAIIDELTPEDRVRVSARRAPPHPSYDGQPRWYLAPHGDAEAARDGRAPGPGGHTALMITARGYVRISYGSEGWHGRDMHDPAAVSVPHAVAHLRRAVRMAQAVQEV